MLKATSNRSKMVLVVSVLFLLAALAPTSFAAKNDSPVVVVEYVQDGNVVHVTVKNNSRKAQTVNVFVDAIVGSTTVRAFTPVAVFGRGTAVTVVGFSDVVESIETVGIGEDSGPV